MAETQADSSFGIDIPLLANPEDLGKRIIEGIGKELKSSVEFLSQKSAQGMAAITNGVLDSASQLEGWANKVDSFNKSIGGSLLGFESGMKSFFDPLSKGISGISGSFELFNEQFVRLGDSIVGAFTALIPPSLKNWLQRKEKNKSKEQKAEKQWWKVLNNKWFDKTLNIFKNLLSGMGDIFMDLLILFIAMAIFDPSGSLMMSILQFLLQMIVMVGNMLIAILPRVIAMIPPIIAQFAQGLIGAIQQLAPMVGTILKMLIQVALTLIDAIVAALPSVLEALIGGVLSILTDPKILTGILQVLVKIVVGLASGLVTLIRVIVENLPMIIENLVTALIGAIPAIIEAIIPLLPLIVVQLITLIIRLVPVLLKSIVSLIEVLFTSLINAFTSDAFLKPLLEVGDILYAAIMEPVNYLVEGITNAFNFMYDMTVGVLKKVANFLWKYWLKPIISVYVAVFKVIMKLFEFIWRATGAGSVFKTIIDSVMRIIDGVANIGKNILEQINIENIGAKLKETFDKFIKWLTEDSAIGKIIKKFVDMAGSESYSKEEAMSKITGAASSEEQKKVSTLIRHIQEGNQEEFYQNKANVAAIAALTEELQKQGKLKDLTGEGKIDNEDFIQAVSQNNKEIVDALLELIKTTKQGQKGTVEIFSASQQKPIRVF